MQTKIEIPEEITNVLWRLDTDCQGYKDVIIYILNHSEVNVPNELFKEYQQQYLTAKFAFEVAKKEMAKNYIYQDYPELKNQKWSLDYAENIITVFQKDDINNENT